MSQTVLAFGAHPDDAELAFGATMARLATHGARVVIVDATRGERGSRGDPETRAREAAESARLLGVAGRENLGLPDLGVRPDDPAHVRALVECLRRHRPALVLAPHPLEGHPDHRATAALVERAALESRLARADATGDPHVVPQILFALPGAGGDQGGGAGDGGALAGGLVVDVTASFAKKRDALLAYRSQFAPGPGVTTRLNAEGFLELVDARARVAGASIGARYGEGFTWRGALRLGPLLAALAGEEAPSKAKA